MASQGPAGRSKPNVHLESPPRDDTTLVRQRGVEEADPFADSVVARLYERGTPKSVALRQIPDAFEQRSASQAFAVAEELLLIGVRAIEVRPHDLGGV